MDGIIASLRPMLAERGFRRSSRIFRKHNADGLCQVVAFRMSRWFSKGDEKAGFSVNCGIYVPEVWRYAVQADVPLPKAMKEEDCCIDYQINFLLPAEMRGPLETNFSQLEIKELSKTIETHAFPFFDRFATRELILGALKAANYDDVACRSGPGLLDAVVTAAVILRSRGDDVAASALIQEAISRVGRRTLPRLVSETKLIERYKGHAS